MLDQEKISIGRIRQAYHLTESEVDALIQALWPHAVHPAELWLKAYQTYWKECTDSSQAALKNEIPVLPQPSLTEKHLHTYLFGCDIQDFFQKISLTISVKFLELGLNSILEQVYDDISTVFPEEREFLFHALKRLETEHLSEPFSPDSPHFGEPIFAIPASSYHFISSLFVDTILVNRDDAIKFLRNYPLHKEVKGITRTLVESVLKAAPQENISPQMPQCKAEPLPTEQFPVEETEDGRLTFRIPAAVWRGKPDHAVRDAMKDSYPPAVIAYVLFYWCGPEKPETGHKAPVGRKTQLGRLFTDKEYSDPKSYRNLLNALLKKADAYTIVKA